MFTTLNQESCGILQKKKKVIMVNDEMQTNVSIVFWPINECSTNGKVVGYEVETNIFCVVAIVDGKCLEITQKDLTKY